MISVSNLGKWYGDHTLFRKAAFLLNPGERYGLVGANGSGKTTLLSILAGDLEPSEGAVSIPGDVRLGVLRQDQFLHDEQPILDVALMGNRELWDAMHEKEQLLAVAEADPEAFDADRFGMLEETVQRFDGYTAEARAATILEGLGLPGEIHRDPLSTLSGGFKLRVLLAQVLAAAPDALLLDEPTNHLDILSIRWLETFLQGFDGPVVVISHDHRFLDNVATKILDVDYETVTLYHGNYTHFIAAKQEERERREKEIEAREKEIARNQEFVDRFRAKNTKARQAQSKLKVIERLQEELEPLPGTSRRYPHFRFEPWRASGKEVLKVKGVEKAYGDNEVLHGVGLQVRRGDRVAILGPNGIGKSTLLKIAVGVTEADAGDVEWGHETHVGYFAQDHHEQLGDDDRTLEEWLWSHCPGKDRGFVRANLGAVLFSGDEAKKRVTALSGGEAARLIFARLALERPNVLVLDEPTNHLDLEAIEALVEALKSYEGTLVLVSHDRWFVGQLATRIVEITREGMRDYPGSYEEYVHALGDDHLDADAVVLKAKQANRNAPERGDGAESGATRRRPRINRFKLERTRDEVTAEIERVEARIAEIDDDFAKPDYYETTDPAEMTRAQRKRSELEARLEHLMEKWEEVATTLAEAD